MFSINLLCATKRWSSFTELIKKNGAYLHTNKVLIKMSVRLKYTELCLSNFPADHLVYYSGY